MKNRDLSSRDFLAAGSAALAETALTPFLAATSSSKRVPIYIFSKHLQWLDYEDFAAKSKEIEYDGVEVTLRKG